MEEKYIQVKIKILPEFEYKVYYGGCVMMRGKPINGNNGEVVYWFSFSDGEEMRKTWSDYEYFVDNEGDISRKLRNVEA